MGRSTKAPLVALLLAGAFALGGCDSSDDDDGGGDGNGNADGGDMMPPVTGTPEEASGDIFAIAGRGDTDEPARLDEAALAAQLGDDGFLGDGSSVEPLEFEDGEDVVTALRRRQSAGGAN